MTSVDNTTTKTYTITVTRESASGTGSSGGGGGGGGSSSSNGNSTPKPPVDVKTHTAYIKGIGDGTFRPEQFVTRAQMAAMLSRNLPTTTVTVQPYADIEKNSWVYAEVMKVKQLGIMHGNENNEFKPNDSITRAQMATIAYRWIKRECETNKTAFASCASVKILSHIRIQM